MTTGACVVVPAYHEAAVIAGVVAQLVAVFPLVVVVDDGSQDATAAQAAAAGAVVVRHALNLGQGAALETGLRYGLERPDVECFITFDADGQHQVGDALLLLQDLRRGDVDVVLGSRFLDPAGAAEVPRRKRWLLRLGTVVNNVTSGVRLTDSHNGLRAFNRSFAQRLQFTTLDMGHASQLTSILAGSGLRYREVPVTIRYTDYSRGKGQRAVNAINILFDVSLSPRGKRR